jgi:hypothetical protein
MSIVYWIPNATDTHSEYVTHCFSITTNVARAQLSVTLHVHCLSCFLPVSAQQMVRAAVRTVAAGTDSRGLSATKEMPVG